MRKGPFLPKQFTPTQWSTQDDKAEFGKHAAALHRFRVQADVVHEEAVLVRVSAPDAVLAAAGSRVPPQRGADVASGTPVSGSQVHRRVSADAPRCGDSGSPC